MIRSARSPTGWFTSAGVTNDKQSAADKATEEWWRLITTPLPRDVETEIDIIVARILVIPPPNCVLAEDMAFLQRLNRLLFKQFEDEIKAGATTPVSNLLANLQLAESLPYGFRPEPVLGRDATSGPE